MRARLWNSDYISNSDSKTCSIFQHGKLKDVRLVTYRSGASKGLAYVEFENEVTYTEIQFISDTFLVFYTYMYI